MDVAALAIVAYGEVLADGSSPSTNSGVTTAKTGTGQYSITLPAGKLQSGAKDLMFVTPKVANPTGAPVSHSIDDTDPAVKTVALYGGSAPLATFADCAFSFLILRTTITPPAGVPG
jgi:hypothetical protein